MAIDKKRRDPGQAVITGALQARLFGLSHLRDCKMWQRLGAFVKDEAAATAIEYAIIAAGISIVIVAAVGGIGTRLNTTFGSVSTQLK